MAIKPAVVMQTDFGRGLAVAQMYGVCRMVDPEVPLFDGNHDVPTFNVLAASESLLAMMPFWPKDTVFISVVDPGVGTPRRACAAKLAGGQVIITPDNGSLTYQKLHSGITEVREIDETVNRYRGTEDVSIFHGRDLFAYCAARLASGVITWEQVGPAYPVDEIVEAPFVAPKAENGVLSGMVTMSTSHFGLVDTNIPFRWLRDNGVAYGDTVHVVVRRDEQVYLDEVMKHEKSFGFVPVGDLVLVCSETQHVLIAINQGNIVEEYDIGEGADWTLTVQKAQV